MHPQTEIKDDTAWASLKAVIKYVTSDGRGESRRLTSCVAGVERGFGVHALDAAEQMHIWILVPHDEPLPSDHHVTHCEGAVHIVDLQMSQQLEYSWELLHFLKF